MSNRAMAFARFIVVDWSAASTPKRGRDSIWIASSGGSPDDPIDLANPPTRAAAVTALDGLVMNHVASNARSHSAGGASMPMLIGIDASLGYPVGTAAALGLAGTPWTAMWSLLARIVDDDERNRNNRFAVAGKLNAQVCGGTDSGAGPFWGAPLSACQPMLTAHKVEPPAGLAQWRLVEVVLRERGLRPFSAWQLLGAGSVGSQTLLAIARCSQLLDRWRRAGVRCEVWPFTTGLDVPPATADVVLVEVWPSLQQLPPDGHPVRDARQVTAAVDRLRRADRSGELASWWAPNLTSAERHTVETEEGWVLGVC